MCPRCGTLLRRGRAFCGRCGKALDGPLARCDECGGASEKRARAPAEIVERLVRIPGVDESVARQLHARGFSDPADVLKLALPDRAVRLGLHRTLARKVTMEELTPGRRVRKFVPCPVCGAARPSPSEPCPACGLRGEREPKPEDIQRTIAQVEGEVSNLTADPDFQGMPGDMRDEILEAFQGLGLATSFESEYSEQVREWQARGFQTAELERVLREEGSEAFREKSVPVIRAQVRKHREDGRFRCPLCEVALSPSVEECGNCGAKFR